MKINKNSAECALVTVNSEISARILFLLIALKDIFATLKFVTRAGFTYMSKRQSDFCHFARVLFLRKFAHEKFRENKTLMKISEFTVHGNQGHGGYLECLQTSLSKCKAIVDIRATYGG